MNCEAIKEKLSLYIDNQLDESQIKIVEEHLRECAECREYYDNLLKLGEMVDSFEIGADDDYWMSQKEKIINKIEEAEKEKITPVTAKRSKFIYYRVAAVAAAIALVAFVSIFESMQIEPTDGLFAPKKSPAVKEQPVFKVLEVEKAEEGKGVLSADSGEREADFESYQAIDMRSESDEIGIAETKISAVEQPKPDEKIDESADKLEMKSVTKIAIPVIHDENELKAQIGLKGEEKVKPVADIEQLTTPTSGVITSGQAEQLLSKKVYGEPVELKLAKEQPVDTKSKAGRNLTMSEQIVEAEPEDEPEVQIDVDSYDDDFAGISRVDSEEYRKLQEKVMRYQLEPDGAILELEGIQSTVSRSKSKKDTLTKENILEMAETIYKLGEITQIKSERQKMIEYLNKLKIEADSETVITIDSLITNLESISD